MTSKEINVIKRNGRGKEPLNIDKIHSMVGYAVQDITGVSASHVEMNSGIQFYDGITTDDIQQILIKSANDFSYDDIGGNVYKSWKYDNEKEMNGNFVFNNISPSNPFGTNESYMLVDDNLNCSACSI